MNYKRSKIIIFPQKTAFHFYLEFSINRGLKKESTVPISSKLRRLIYNSQHQWEKCEQRCILLSEHGSAGIALFINVELMRVCACFTFHCALLREEVYLIHERFIPALRRFSTFLFHQTVLCIVYTLQLCSGI